MGLFAIRQQGALKLHMPMEVFNKCDMTERPDNTLFPHINSFRVGFSDMKFYLPLILALFAIDPQCAFGWVLSFSL